MMRKSRLDNSRDALITELCTIDLLIIDDFALERMPREESRDVYQLFIERNARASTIVTSIATRLTGSPCPTTPFSRRALSIDSRTTSRRCGKDRLGRRAITWSHVRRDRWPHGGGDWHKEGFEFFKPLGWRTREVRNPIREAYRVRRVPWFMRVLKPRGVTDGGVGQSRLGAARTRRIYAGCHEVTARFGFQADRMLRADAAGAGGG